MFLWNRSGGQNIRVFVDRQGGRMHYLEGLQRAFDGALTPMMQFLIEHEALSKEEAAKLRELVDRSEGKKSGRSRRWAR